MLAVIKSGGKQYKVKKGDIVDLELLSQKNAKKEVILKDVLLIADSKKVTVGQPIVKGAKVVAETVDQVKGKKEIVYKYKKRKNYNKKVGHRQQYSRLLIKDVVFKDE